MWWKKNKWKFTVPALIVVLLAVSFWYGGGSPGSRGWTARPDSSQASGQAAPDLSPEAETHQAVEPSAESESPEKTPVQGTEHFPDTQAQPEEDEKGAQPALDDGSKTDRDQYLTDIVPEGKPEPVEPQAAQTGTKELTCTISVSCAAILDHMDWLDPEKAELVPEDGWLLEPVQVTFYEGESVYNVLRRTCKQQKLHMEFRDTPIYNSAYIEGIGNLYEFDCGEQSGWMYAVNDWYPNYGCSRYQLKDGDVICWRYTCDLGTDIGGANAVGG